MIRPRTSAARSGPRGVSPLAKCAAVLALTAALALWAPPPHAAASSAPSRVATVGPPVDVSAACRGQNAEVEQAVDRSIGYVYEDWMGCDGIGFARSRDGGRSFDAPLHLPGSLAPHGRGWDPAIALGPAGTVYVAFMLQQSDRVYPVVEASFDHGRTFPQVSALAPSARGNWGDREFLTVGPDGAVYVTWDYGPNRTSVTYICTPGGSCAFATGDLNVVVQRSSDGGRTWGPIVPVSPGFPASGGDSGPLLAEPNGRLDVLYQGYRVTNPTTFALAPAHTYFTSSADKGATWSTPVLVGADAPQLTMSLAEWWIDGSLGIDGAGNLYATWDTQEPSRDVAWIATSTDGGEHWSPLQRVTPDEDTAPHITEVVGGAGGVAYVGWLSNSAAQGWAQYVRAYSIRDGWLTAPIRVSGMQFGAPGVWPGDTFGISLLSPHRVVLAWGGAVPGPGRPRSEIRVATVLIGEPGSVG